MAIPLHADHVQPSDLPALAEMMRKTQIAAFVQDAAGLTDNDTIATFECPCAGILERPYMHIAAAGTNNKTDVVIEKREPGGAAVEASSVMSVAGAGAGANDNTTVIGTFVSTALQTCAKGDRIPIRVEATSAASRTGLSAGVTVVALGRTS